ncbi:zinc-ribbon domain-containing protein [Ramlibacter ginsenosidimutans]|uniref:Zinc-ribbon domain-containing protein n=1 Tax=Ramlibacter ginsenosidimutans TaxID=502333 RepID=A0A934WQB1_9BURK|nr:DUF3426 domain-containing protein [Ramlibacter ginsenosidimutans]MBK6009152.1 zinc-ribbon domain-containing protein [Ramlibacter ginsenosidimutans]
MSLITSCPACGTMFRVVPDQLKISEGWVRCGHCSEVFDATAHLTDESVLGNLPEAKATTHAPLPPPSPPDDQATTPDTLQPRPADLYARPTAGAEDQADSRSTDPSDFFLADEADPALEPSPLDAPFVFRRSEITLSDLGPETGREGQALSGDFDREEDEDDDEDVPNVSFVRKARRQAWWTRPGVRLVLALLALVLGLLLALQVAWQDRDRLALAQPMLRPALQHMCDALHCTIGPPRQIDAILIDSSAFNRLRNDTYRLSFTLRNTAPTQVAAPAMELTITDSQDQTVVRRVLSPAELGSADGVIPAAGEWSRTVGVRVDPGSAARVAGYRLLAFYP